MRASSTTGVRAAGPICAIPSAPTISRASESRAMSEDVDRRDGKPPHLDRLSLLWRRVAERKIVQWSVAYVALAYGIQHGVVLTREAFDWPHGIEQISMLLLALGLPVVTVFAWYHGERASRRISGPELTIITILLAIGSLFFYVLVK